MATIKSYTDLEQSKKLIKILPFESADMYYPIEGESPKFGVAVSILHIPCWSLAALLYIIPKQIKYYNVLAIDISENEFEIRYDEIAYRVNNDLPNITKDNPIDACVVMIEKLHEQNLL